ncbi:hypothetical protein SLEP1_g47818 [Rubroshorea leprosula]|uniref:Uncharacterized protein n=1 Tax=Rubroshorea leprosula TaxID=152421 RepID=A0AAV5LU08_9ROSI|nr:hypothetical protein SLEP1_g47818 [Rubroshorea leprosula]
MHPSIPNVDVFDLLPLIQILNLLLLRKFPLQLGIVFILWVHSRALEIALQFALSPFPPSFSGLSPSSLLRYSAYFIGLFPFCQ